LPCSHAARAPTGPLRHGFGAGADAWLFRKNAWQRLESVPTSRRASNAAYDPARRRVVLFGADDVTGMLGDTWEWDGQRWLQISTR
jgi:hypothetical protein